MALSRFSGSGGLPGAAPLLASWGTVDLMAGYSFDLDGVKTTAQVNIANLLDQSYYNGAGVMVSRRPASRSPGTATDGAPSPCAARYASSFESIPRPRRSRSPAFVNFGRKRPEGHDRRAAERPPGFGEFFFRPRGEVPSMIRRIFVFLHRWVGLLMTAFLVVVGLTGSLLAFGNEIERFVRVNCSRRRARRCSSIWRRWPKKRRLSLHRTPISSACD